MSPLRSNSTSKEEATEEIDVHPSSLEYHYEMGIGWRKGLHHIYKSRVRIGLEEMLMGVDGKKEFALDFIARFDRPIGDFSELLPAQRLVRPLSASVQGCQSFLAEIRRSLDDMEEGEFDQSIQQFVRIYYALLNPHNGSFQRPDGTETAIDRSTHSTLLKTIMEDDNVVLLFVFNGADHAKVEKTVWDAIRSLTGNDDLSIHGRRVICVWCHDAELIKWEDMMNFAKTKREHAKLMAEKLERERLKARIAYLEKQLRKKQKIR